MKPTASTARRGFALIESLIALVIVAFGLLVLAGVNLKLARNEDVAKQRSEAARLAQEKVEELRSFTQIDAAAGAKAWADLATGSDAISDSAEYRTNTSFTRNWQVLGNASDPMRRVQVTVSWTDRVGEAQSVSFGTVISKTDPSDVGSLGFPLPDNTTLKRPKNRNLNIPVPAVDLGNGQSVVQLQNNFAVVFSNESGYVVKTCAFVVNTVSDLAGCSETAAYIIAGYLSLDGTGSFPAGLDVNTAQITGATGVTCSVQNAVDQNTNTVISGYKYYLCVVSVPTAGATWGGTLRLSGPGLNSGATNYMVCRFQYPTSGGGSGNQRNVQPYSGVGESLDNQNYVLTAGSACPTISSLATTLHQNCRGSNPNKNLNRATDCPA
ncbi:MAG: prepilin-type N-terminal cleavage/methylation domain-containing protein [Burkholderiales bacterium]|nr:prepilin-type N-terminal cleavage/methylation domain-containing protein [Burkholderiales bacterium]